MGTVVVKFETDHSAGDRVFYQDQEDDMGTVEKVTVKQDATGYDTWSVQVLYLVRWDRPVKTPYGTQVTTEHPSDSLCWTEKYNR